MLHDGCPAVNHGISPKLSRPSRRILAQLSIIFTVVVVCNFTFNKERSVFEFEISRCGEFIQPYSRDPTRIYEEGEANAFYEHLITVFSHVDHIYVLSKENCVTKVSTEIAQKTSCISGNNLDECAPTWVLHGSMSHAKRVSFSHAVIMQLASQLGHGSIAVIEDDVRVLPRGYSAEFKVDFSGLLKSRDWGIIRFGYRPYFLQMNGASRCPSRCRCVVQQHGENFCKLRHTGCDLRSSDMYIIHSQHFLDVQRSIIGGLKHQAEDMIVDLRPLSSLKDQWLIIPQATVQSHLDIPFDYQVGLGALFVSKCVLPRPLPLSAQQQILGVV